MPFDKTFDSQFGGSYDTDAVSTIMDLLSVEDDRAWTIRAPQIKRWWDDAQSERGPGADQPGVLYVWSPTGSSLDRFSMDAQVYDRNDTVEIQAWSLDEAETEQLRQDVVRILSAYLDDNETLTPFTDIQPTTSTDFREQKQARKTNHYIASVEVETTDLDRAGNRDETVFTK